MNKSCTFYTFFPIEKFRCVINLRNVHLSNLLLKIHIKKLVVSYVLSNMVCVCVCVPYSRNCQYSKAELLCINKQKSTQTENLN
jgi:hypothetical protein